ncbi:hypothetical protein ACVIN2_005830 [Bradyrhizobium sp. USDA 3650]
MFQSSTAYTATRYDDCEADNSDAKDDFAHWRKSGVQDYEW